MTANKLTVIFYPGRKSRDFKNYRKSVKLERPLWPNPGDQQLKKIVVQYNLMKALHHYYYIHLYSP